MNSEMTHDGHEHRTATPHATLMNGTPYTASVARLRGRVIGTICRWT